MFGLGGRGLLTKSQLEVIIVSCTFRQYIPPGGSDPPSTSCMLSFYISFQLGTLFISAGLLPLLLDFLLTEIDYS